MKITHTKITAATEVNSAVDTGLEYWYFTRHGMGPGTIPSGVQVLDWYEEGYKTWMKLDKMLTTSELNDYDLYEEFPPAGSVTHNGDEIKACDQIEGATLEEMQKAMEEYTSKADAAGEQLDALQQDLIKKYGPQAKKPGFLNKLLKKKTNASNCTKVDETDDTISYVISSEDIEASVDLDSIDLNELKKEIEEGCIEYLCGPEGGFSRPGTPKEDRWDINADEIFVAEVKREDEHIVIEVRAELSYDGMDAMADILNEIVKKYDPHAYFEQVEPGIMDCYMWSTDEIDELDDIGSSEEIDEENIIINAAAKDEYNEKVIDREERRRLEPSDKDEIEDEDKAVNSQFAFDVEVTVDDDYNVDVTDGDPTYHADLLDDYGIDDEQMNEDFLGLLEWHIPADPGKYALKGKAKMVYEKSPYDEYVFAGHLSNISDLDVTRIGKVESSTDVDVTAAMTEEDLDDAILNNKPFDLESFKKWKNPINPDAILAQDVQVGDIIDIEEDASEVNLGTVVKILAINDPAESWIDYTFRCEVIEHDGGMQDVETGSIIELHFDENDPIGYLMEE